MKDLYNAASVQLAETTRIKLFLPGLGGQELNPNDVGRRPKKEEASSSSGYGGARGASSHWSVAQGALKSAKSRLQSSRATGQATAESVVPTPQGLPPPPQHRPGGLTPSPASESSRPMPKLGGIPGSRRPPLYHQITSRFMMDDAMIARQRREMLSRQAPLPVLEPEQPTYTLRAVPNKVLELGAIKPLNPQRTNTTTTFYQGPASAPASLGSNQQPSQGPLNRNNAPNSCGLPQQLAPPPAQTAQHCIKYVDSIS